MSIISIKSKLNQYLAFIGYRYLAYTFELKQLLQQLKNFGLLFLVGGGDLLLLLFGWQNWLLVGLLSVVGVTNNEVAALLYV